MREARIILPNCMPDCVNANRWLETEIVRCFGGCTRSFGFGSWVDDEGCVISEPISIYDIAVPDIQASRSALFRMAWTVADMAKQDCVYLRFPDGEVQLVKPSPANEPREERNTGTTPD